MRGLFKAIPVATMCFCVVFGGIACNGGPEDGLGVKQDLLVEEEAVEGTEESITPSLVWRDMILRPVKMRDCWYFIAYERPSPGDWQRLVVRRMATEHCEGKTVTLDYSRTYSTPLIATKGENAIVIALQVAGMKGGPPFVKLYNISPETMQNDRLYNNVIEWDYGPTAATHLFFEGTTLVVQGDKDGGPPPEWQRPYYTAKFKRFLDSFDPPSITYHAELPEGPSTTPELINTTYNPPFEYSTAGQYAAPIQVKNCWYFISSKFDTSGGAMQEELRVERLPVENCEGKISPVLARTWRHQPFLVAEQGKTGIALAYMVGSRPYREPNKNFVRLLNISPETVENTRLINDQLRSATGDVFASKLEFHGKDLVVYGTKTGPIDVSPPESGSGSNYIATFEDFLDSTKPPSVVAY